MLDMCISNSGTFRYVKQMLMDLKGEIASSSNSCEL